MAKRNKALGSKKTNVEAFILKTIRKREKTKLCDLAQELYKNYNIPVEKTAKIVYKLAKEGKVRLVDPQPPRTFGEYALSLYSTWFWISIAVILLSYLSIYVLPPALPYIILRYVVGSVIVLYLPGCSLVEALYPQPEDLEPLERLALSLGLSLAIVPLVGLVLNYTPWGIRLTPVLVSLTSLTGILLIVALWRKYTYHMLKLEARG